MQYDPAKSDDGRIDGSISSRRAPSRAPSHAPAKLLSAGATTDDAFINCLLSSMWLRQSRSAVMAIARHAHDGHSELTRPRYAVVLLSHLRRS